jgi:DNA uptake protein ComE-like DNA-binding protein
MKTIFDFTRGEWIAVSVIAVVIIASYLTYYLYDRNLRHQVDPPILFTAMVASQDCVNDSLPNQQRQNSDMLKNFNSQKASKKAHKYEIVKLNLNSCDTIEICKIPLFGSKRAAKLIEYRTLFGGFYSFKQFQELFIFQSIPLEHWEKYFFIDTSEIKALYINQASYKELLAHPYLDAYLVKCILQEREKNGRIPNEKKLQEITHAYPELLEQLRPYLQYD